MAVVAAMSAVAIDTTADISTTGVCKIEVHKSRYWIVAMVAMMALMLCISLGSQCAAGVVFPSQTNGEIFDVESRR